MCTNNNNGSDLVNSPGNNPPASPPGESGDNNPGNQGQGVGNTPTLNTTPNDQQTIAERLRGLLGEQGAVKQTRAKGQRGSQVSSTNELARSKQDKLTKRGQTKSLLS